VYKRTDSIQVQNLSEDGHYMLTYKSRDATATEETSQLRLRPRSSEDVAAPLATITLNNYRQEDRDNNNSLWDALTITDTKPEYIEVTRIDDNKKFYYIWDLTSAYVWTGLYNNLKIKVTSDNGTYILKGIEGITGELLLTPKQITTTTTTTTVV